MTVTMWLFTCVMLTFLSELCVYCQDMDDGEVHCRVVCKPGYVYSQENSSILCGQVPNQCLRHIWSAQEDMGCVNEDEGYPVPLVPGARWSVCISATPTKYTRITVDFNVPGGRIIVSHFDIRMRDNYGPEFDDSIVVNEKDDSLNYPWRREDTYHPRPYPFAVGQSFTLNIKALDEHTLTYFVNGRHIARRSVTHPVSLVSNVTITGDVNVKSVDTWCSY